MPRFIDAVHKTEPETAVDNPTTEKRQMDRKVDFLMMSIESFICCVVIC